MNRLLEILHSGAQGASNSAASSVASPIDGIAWALRRAGINIPQDAVGGTEWMKQVGLMQEPSNRLAGLFGDGIGATIPMLAASRNAKLTGHLMGSK